MSTDKQNENVVPFDTESENTDTAGAEAPEAAVASEAPDAVEGEAAPDDEVTALRQEVEELKADRLRAIAEAENAKKQAERRIQDNSKYAVSNFAKSMLPVADNLERALLAAPENVRAENDALKNLAVGVEMTEKELQNALQAMGVSRMHSLNEPFDPNKHQAMQEVEDTSVPAGTVVQVMAEGYFHHERLLRPAMVVVSKGGPKREAPSQPQSGAPQGQGGDADPNGGVDTEV